MEELLFRLDTFPVNVLKDVLFVSPQPLEVYAKALARVGADIAMQSENTLAAPRAEEL